MDPDNSSTGHRADQPLGQVNLWELFRLKNEPRLQKGGYISPPPRSPLQFDWHSIVDSMSPDDQPSLSQGAHRSSPVESLSAETMLGQLLVAAERQVIGRLLQMYVLARYREGFPWKTKPAVQQYQDIEAAAAAIALNCGSSVLLTRALIEEVLVRLTTDHRESDSDSDGDGNGG